MDRSNSEKDRAFVEKYGIEMDDFVSSGGFSHFNAFFIVDCRSASRCKGFAGCGISCRWPPFGISVYFESSGFSIKGQAFDLPGLVGGCGLAARGGGLMISRLCRWATIASTSRLLELREISPAAG